MKFNKSFQFRLYPTKEQKTVLAKHFGCNRLIWNMFLEERTKHYEETQEGFNYQFLTTSLTQLKKHSELFFLNEINSQTLQQTLKNQQQAFINFFQNSECFGYPNFKAKKNRQSFRVPQFVEVNIESGYTKLCKIGNIPTIFHRKIEGEIKSATITKTPANSYFVSFCCELEQEIVKKDTITKENTLGIDFGLKSMAVDSNGNVTENPKFLKKSEKKLAHHQRILARKLDGSENREDYRIIVAKVYEKISNQRKDFLQKFTTKIVNDNQIDNFIVEDLNIDGMLKNHKVAKAIQDISWSATINMLKYKSEWLGKNLYKIGRFDPSSQLCHVCNYQNKELTLKDRFWVCPQCHTQHDRDKNAAINIQILGIAKVLRELKEKQDNEALGIVEKKKRTRKTKNSEKVVKNPSEVHTPAPVATLGQAKYSPAEQSAYRVDMSILCQFQAGARKRGNAVQA